MEVCFDVNVRGQAFAARTDEELEKERKKLYSVVRKYGLNSPQALSQSKLVDRLVLHSMSKINRKPK